MKNRTQVVCIGVVVISCLWVANGSSQSTQAPRRSIRVLHDVPYYTGTDADPKHVADLFLPEKVTGSIPAIYFIHGGGWRGGDKVYEGLPTLVNKAVDMGMAVMSVNYRVFPQAGPKGMMQDLARGFAWLQRNGAQYGIDRGAIFVAGGSAGAHLAALLAVDGRYLAAEGSSPDAIKGVVLSSGVYDMAYYYSLGRSEGNVRSQTGPEANSAVAGLRASAAEIFGADRTGARDLSAAAHVGEAGERTPPFLIAYTDDDVFGMAEQAIGLYGLFVKRGLRATLIEQPGRTHATKTSGFGVKIRGADDVFLPAIERFMRSVMAGTFGETEQAVRPRQGAADPAVRTVKDLRYDDSPQADAALNTLDLHLPASNANVPLVVFVHGGAWSRGDKASAAPLVKPLARLGIGVASVNYRLAPQARHPAQVRDVARAVAWVVRHAGEYNINAQRIVLVGASSGAQIASLLAFDTRYLQQEGLQPSVLAGVVGVSGVYNLQTWAEPVLFPTRTEVAFGTEDAVLRDASPATYVRASAPPTLLTFTDWDIFLIREQALELYNRMLSAGAPVELAMIPGRTHMGIEEIGRNVNQVDDVLGPVLSRFVVERLRAAKSGTASVPQNGPGTAFPAARTAR